MDADLARFNMVEQQLRPSNINDKNLLSLFTAIRREQFTPLGYEALAFADLNIPLPGGQTMLSPTVEGKLLQALSVTTRCKVLEIGCGSGYVTALLAKMADFVYAFEINELNKQLALKNLHYSGTNNISIVHADGLDPIVLGESLYDRIFIGGGLCVVPDTIKSRLKVGGRLVAFIGIRPILHAVLIIRIDTHIYIEKQLFETDVDYLIGSTSSHFVF